MQKTQLQRNTLTPPVILPPTPSTQPLSMKSHPFLSPPSSIIMGSKRSKLALSSPPLSTPSPPSNPNPNGSKPQLEPKLASKPSTRRSLTPSLIGWHPLPVPRSELSLPLTLPTGQTFRWRRTAASAFTGVIGPHLLSLRHVDASADGQVELLHHNPSSSSSSLSVEEAVNDYFNLGVDLGEMWRGFGDVDPRFAELAARFGGGARVLRQEPLECLFQFLCSSNNNIARIEKMVGVISSFGRRLGSVGEFEFFEFPTIERLAMVTEAELRDAGCGYRFDFLVKCW